MRSRMFAVGMVLATLLGGAIGTAGPVPAQPDDDIDALNQRVLALITTAKFADAVPLARRFTALTKARYGEDSPRYAAALNDLAELLRRGTNRPTEAESLVRRALAINEKSLGPNHPDVARADST